MLYSNGVLEYFDPQNSEYKGNIQLDKECKVLLKSENVFHLVRPEREYIFKCIDVTADTWVTHIAAYVN